MTFCVECEDTKFDVSCRDCNDNYCNLCFKAQHRRGNRKSHRFVKVVNPVNPVEVDDVTKLESSENAIMYESVQKSLHLLNGNTVKENTTTSSSVMDMKSVSNKYLRKCSFVPMRLSEEERSLFVLLDAALRVSEYTDKVDVLSNYRMSNTQRILKELHHVFNVILGLYVASNYRKGKKCVLHKELRENEELFKRVFEIGRRFKLMNPDKMRDNYGKMIYMLQDSARVEEELGFSCIGELKTVANFVREKKRGVEMLCDSRMKIATKSIVSDSSVDRETIQHAVLEKKRAMEELCREYQSDGFTSDEIQYCLASLADNASYFELNCGPIERMIGFLEEYFDPDHKQDPYSLAISAGRQGARLTHSHKTQYHYALQSLCLWRDMTSKMFKLWLAAEKDLLGHHGYRLRDTGQGLNRVQRAPMTSKISHSILHKSMSSTTFGWVGSSVIHLGDHNVPNALMFIDKYTQISRILSPIVQTIDEIDHICTNPQLEQYIKKHFNSVNDCRRIILTDFFRHAFNGSGADNFFDAGSCIDGRLTSAWHWCSHIEKKSYHPIFLLAGFVGFDGQFSN